MVYQPLGSAPFARSFGSVVGMSGMTLDSRGGWPLSDMSAGAVLGGPCINIPSAILSSTTGPVFAFFVSLASVDGSLRIPWE